MYTKSVTWPTLFLQEEKEKSGRARYNGRQFLSWLKDLDDKFEKLKVGINNICHP